MSSHHLRHERNCLNCGATVEERYCTRCGQENVEPKESIAHLIGHFFADITHFDSKLFITLKDLIIRPGFLTHEYVAGRRVAYLNPIRMYVFISAVFFVAMFARSQESEDHAEADTRAVDVYRRKLADSLRRVRTDGLRQVFNMELAARLDSGGKDKLESLGLKYGSSGAVQIDIVENKYNTLHEFDSIQLTLPDSSREKGTMRWIIRNNIRQKIKHGGVGNLHLEVNVQHDIPKIMFVLLPLFALYVGWLNRGKKYYYVSHAIFSIHFHSFVFLFFLLLLSLSAILPGNYTGLVLAAVSPVPIFVYLVAALGRVYGQSAGMSILKAIGISLLYIVTLSVASTSLLLLALMRI